jgi:hypothetical protein
MTAKQLKCRKGFPVYFKCEQGFDLAVLLRWVIAELPVVKYCGTSEAQASARESA